MQKRKGHNYKKKKKKKARIYVKANSLSSRSLLIMDKSRIIRDWNTMFPNAHIKEVVVMKGY